LKQKVRKDSCRKDENFRVGIEIEVCLIDRKSGLPVDAKPLISRMKRKKHALDFEYGKCQFEYRTEHLAIDKLDTLNRLLEDFVEVLGIEIDRTYSKSGQDVVPAFLGANPSPGILGDEWVTDKPRYRDLAKWQSNMPDVEMEGHRFKALHSAYAIQGFHFHLQGSDPSYAAMMFNHILGLIPSLILLGANSRLFAGRVFSIHEPRLYIYDQTEQQNSGFPAISRYLDGVEDYIDYITSREPIIAKDFFEMVKDRHDDARIRFTGGRYRVETRVGSVQPTAKTLMAMIEFFVGYLHQAAEENRQLRPLSSLREERNSIVRSGYHAKTHFNILDTARNQLSVAHKGLADLGIKRQFLNILEQRLENRTTPGDYVGKLWQSKLNGSTRETLSEVLSEIWDKTKNNTPIV
jgi:gamma-glutamyl:cysteine ligase YbdK (ATP-grasp superfamily)